MGRFVDNVYLERADTPPESCGNLDVNHLILSNDAFFPLTFDEIGGDPLKVEVCPMSSPAAEICLI